MRTVLCAEGAAEPSDALAHYLRQHPPSPDDPVRLVFGIRRTPLPFGSIIPSQVTLAAFVPGRGLRDLVAVEPIRWSYSTICHRLATGEFRPDAVLACSTSPDAAGRRTLGVVDGYLGLALRAARHVIVEEVSWLPHVPGAPDVPSSAEVVPSALARGEGAAGFGGPYDAVDLAVARAVVSLLPSRPTLALGLGRVPDAVAHILRDEARAVRLLTGVVTESVRSLVEAGVVSAPIETMSVVGPADLLEWAALDGHVQIRASTFVHNPDQLAEVDGFAAVLGGLEVDLAGNVNAEQAGSRTVSGLGGAPDFAEGAHRSPRGLSIVALRSTDSAGRTRLLDHVRTVTMPGDHIDAIATEHGSARLVGLDSAARSAAIRALFP